MPGGFLVDLGDDAPHGRRADRWRSRAASSAARLAAAPRKRWNSSSTPRGSIQQHPVRLSASILFGYPPLIVPAEPQRQDPGFLVSKASWFGGRLDAHGRDDVGADSVVVPRHERVGEAGQRVSPAMSRQRLTRPSTGEVARTLWDGQGPCGEHVVRAGAEPPLALTPGPWTLRPRRYLQRPDGRAGCAGGTLRQAGGVVERPPESVCVRQITRYDAGPSLHTRPHPPPARSPTR